MKSAHRQAARAKRAELPKFWRAPLPAVKKLDCKLIHWDLVDRFANGTATKDDLWDWIETGLTYSQIMTLLAADGMTFTDEAQIAIAAQLDTYEAITARFVRTGRVGFTGPELLTARAAASVMDGLIDLDRHGIAERAAHWSVEVLGRIRREVYRGMDTQGAMQ